MSQRRDEVAVFLDTAAAPRRAGWLRRAGSGQKADITFEYDADWLRTRDAFSLEPSLVLSAGEQRRPGGGLHAVFSDAAPDRWGQRLLQRRETLVAKSEARKPKALDDWDFLVGTSDIARMGALRLQRASDGAFIDDHKLTVPPKASLRDLEAAADRVERSDAASDDEVRGWLEALIAPGASLGGTRPKATFETVQGQELWIAKFPAPSDRRDMGAWEFVLAELASAASIRVPPHELLRLGSEYHTFASRRFDREGGRRVMFASAMTLLDARDHDTGVSYLNIAEAIERYGSPASGAIDADLEELFRRVVFNAVAGHRDDHLRNHGFLHDGRGWRLAPAFDQNPIPDKREHELAFDEHTSNPDLEVVKSTSPLYRLKAPRANKIVDEVRAAVRPWKDVANRIGIGRDEQELMRNAFMV